MSGKSAAESPAKRQYPTSLAAGRRPHHQPGPQQATQPPPTPPTGCPQPPCTVPRATAGTQCTPAGPPQHHHNHCHSSNSNQHRQPSNNEGQMTKRRQTDKDTIQDGRLIDSCTQVHAFVCIKELASIIELTDRPGSL